MPAHSNSIRMFRRAVSGFLPASPTMSVSLSGVSSRGEVSPEDAAVVALAADIQAHEEAFERFFRERYNPVDHRLYAEGDETLRPEMERLEGENARMAAHSISMLRQLAALPAIALPGLAAKARIAQLCDSAEVHNSLYDDLRALTPAI